MKTRTLTYDFAPTTSFQDALEVAEDVQDRITFIEDFEIVHDDSGKYTMIFEFPELASDDNILNLGSAIAWAETNQTSMIRKFNESRKQND